MMGEEYCSTALQPGWPRWAMIPTGRQQVKAVALSSDPYGIWYTNGSRRASGTSWDVQSGYRSVPPHTPLLAVHTPKVPKAQDCTNVKSRGVLYNCLEPWVAQKAMGGDGAWLVGRVAGTQRSSGVRVLHCCLPAMPAACTCCNQLR